MEFHMNLKKVLILVSLSLGVAFLAHGFFLYQLVNGQFMVGPNDGTAQMLPFKQFLYSQFSQGNFFYSHQFGLGGGIFSQLAYYFSTSTVFFLTFLVVFIGEWVHLVQNPDDILFWANAAVLVNSLRLTLVIVITTFVLRYFKIAFPFAFLGAVLYGASVMYFRHASFWEFFADAYLWLPLLVFGVEKIIREKKPWWFIFAVALSIINNFYFAYMNFIFIGIYAILRFFIKFSKEEVSIKHQLYTYIPATTLGFFIGSFAFVPAVYGFLNNQRPPFEQSIEWFDFHDEIFFTSRYLLIPALFILFICCKSLFRYKPFLLFSLLSCLFILFHYSPMIGSIFNGFSAPQYRFQYMGSFALAATVAIGLSRFWHIPKKEKVLAIGVTATVYIGLFISGLITDRNAFLSIQALTLFGTAMVTVLIIALLLNGRRKSLLYGLVGITLVLHIGLTNAYQKEWLYERGDLQATSAEFLQSHAYDHPLQMDLLTHVEEDAPLSRIEWVADFRNNTPLVQDFNGVSAYSSVLNSQLLFFYYTDLEIDMNRESVSRYSGFGDRANLHSLYQVSHKLIDKEDPAPVPYGFTEVSENERYHLFENEHLLPFARTTSTLYGREQLSSYSVLDKEHAMLTGAIVDEELANEAFRSTVQNRIDDTSITAIGGAYHDGQLTVTDEIGGIDIEVGERQDDEVDDYLSFYLLNNSETAPLFPLTVNEFETDRKSRKSIYKTDINHLTVRVEASETISLRVPQGEYTLTELALYTENYDILQAQQRESTDMQIDLDGRHIKIDMNNEENDQLLMLPVPHEKGWEVKRNGQTVDVEKVNYAFLGVKLEEGENEIRFSYLPPYFKPTLLLAIAGFLLTFIWMYARRK